MHYVSPWIQQPMDPTKAKKNIVMFVKSVVAAVQELHESSLAHNDIRLANICFDENRQAVLIDLDRSDSTKIVNNMYSESTVCSWMDLWTGLEAVGDYHLLFIEFRTYKFRN